MFEYNIFSARAESIDSEFSIISDIVDLIEVVKSSDETFSIIFGLKIAEPKENAEAKDVSKTLEKLVLTAVVDVTAFKNSDMLV
jgi:hypothetical protein